MKKALIAALIIGATGFAFAGQESITRPTCDQNWCENEPLTYDLNFTLVVPKILEFNLTGYELCRDTILFDFVSGKNDAITTDSATGYWKASNASYRAWLALNQATGEFSPSNGKVPHISILSNVPGWKLVFSSTDWQFGAIDQSRVIVDGKKTYGYLTDFHNVVGTTPVTLINNGANEGQGKNEFDLHFSYIMNLADQFNFVHGVAGGSFTQDLKVTLVNPV